MPAAKKFKTALISRVISNTRLLRVLGMVEHSSTNCIQNNFSRVVLHAQCRSSCVKLDEVRLGRIADFFFSNYFARLLGGEIFRCIFVSMYPPVT